MRETLGPRLELLAGRSVRVAQEAEKTARDFLDRHTGLLSPAVSELIVRREASLALEGYTRRRAEGHENDISSRKPGITIFVTSAGKEYVVQGCERAGYPVRPEQIREVTPTVRALRFQTGIYFKGPAAVQFHQEAAPIFQNDQHGTCHAGNKPFAVGDGDLIRVEGDANELWQNSDYTWDGTLRVTTR